MHTIPITVVDDFFKNPDAIVKFAESLDFFENENRYAGVRTNDLASENSEVYLGILQKFCSIFTVNETTFNCDMRFQKIPNTFGSGVPHDDDNAITGIVYLSKNNDDKNCGTSFFGNAKNNLIDLMGAEKRAALKDNNIAAFNGISQQVRESLTETMNVKYRYNRLVAFSGDIIHAQNDLSECDGDRLTLVFFIRDWAFPNPPLVRCKTASHL